MAKLHTAERVSQRDASDNFVFQRSILAYHRAAEIVSGRVLEIGTGMGYGIKVVAPSAKEFITIEGSRTKAKGKIALTDPYTAIYPGGTHMAKRVEGSNWVWDYICKDGKLTYGQQFYYLYADAGQILYDASGYLYVASSVGIQVCDQNGRVRTILSLPSGAVESIAFAGNHLFAISGGKLWVRRLQRSGTHCGVPKSERQG